MDYKSMYDASWSTPFPAIVLPSLLVLYLLLYPSTLAAYLRTNTFSSGDVHVTYLNYQRTKAMQIWLVFFLVETILDGTFSSLSAYFSSIFPWLSTDPISLMFVILGDFRIYFYTILFKVSSTWKAMVLAALLSLPAPLFSSLVLLLGKSYPGQVTWLVHETVSILLAQFLYLGLFPSRPSSFMIGPLILFITHYLLWILADVLILGQYQIGWLLRLIPNFLYYNATVPLVFYLYFLPSSRRINQDS